MKRKYARILFYLGFVPLLYPAAACQGQHTKEINSEDLHIEIEQDSILNIVYQNGKSIDAGSYVVNTHGDRANGRVEFVINKEYKADGVVNFYAAGDIVFKRFSVEDGLLKYINNYDQHNGSLQDSSYFAVADIPVFESGIPVWKKVRVQQQRQFFKDLHTHELVYDGRVVLKTTYEGTRKNIELCPSIYQKMYYENGEVSSIKSYDSKTKQEKYEQFDKQGVKVIEVIQSDRYTDRAPYQERGILRAPTADDFYQKTTYHSNGQLEQKEYFKNGTVTVSHYDASAKLTKEETATYDVMPRLEVM